MKDRKKKKVLKYIESEICHIYLQSYSSIQVHKLSKTIHRYHASWTGIDEYIDDKNLEIFQIALNKKISRNEKRKKEKRGID